MPSLSVFGRRWRVASDDFVIPAIVEIFIRLGWMILIAVVFGIFHLQIRPLGCSDGHMLVVYYSCLTGIMTCHIILNIFVSVISSRGTINNPYPRRNIPILVYIKIVIWIIEVALIVFGSYVGFGVESMNDCEPVVLWTVRVIAIAGWILILLMIIGFFVAFDPTGSTAIGRANRTISIYQKEWETRCKTICMGANCNKNNDEVFKDVSALMATVFNKAADLVMTDVAAGLLLIYNDNHPANKPPTDNIKFSDISATEDTATLLNKANGHIPQSANNNQSPKEWMNVQSAAHFMTFALAAYGWPMYMFSNLCTGICKLCVKCRCCRCRDDDVVVGDSCCQCHTAALLKHTSLNREDILYASFHNKVHETPFYVAFDHKEKSVIISLRGTLSLRDVLTDADAEAEEVDFGGELGTQFVHKGIYAAAQYVHNTLAEQQLLETAFEKKPDYNLVVTGHSLGAGSAALLSILLRDKYPNLKCFAFSPPGWLVSSNLQAHTQDFVCSVVLGNDLVPRLGIVTLEKLKIQILKALRACNKPKHSVLFTGCRQVVCGKEAKKKLDLESGCEGACKDILDLLDAAIKDSERVIRKHAPLFMPGQVMYIESQDDKESYSYEWQSAETFDRIVVGQGMVTDHMPDEVLRTLNIVTLHDGTTC